MSNDQLTGRDLDAAIAVKLFEGFELTHYGEPPQVRPDIPRYSESWDAMRLVVEAMRARGWWCRMDTPFTDGSPDLDEDGIDALFEAGFFRHGYAPNQAGMFHANLLPLAVCRAALIRI